MTSASYFPAHPANYFLVGALGFLAGAALGQVYSVPWLILGFAVSILGVGLWFREEATVRFWTIGAILLLGGAVYSSWLGGQVLLAPPAWWSIFENIFLNLRLYFNHILVLALPFPHNQLAAGLVFGSSPDFPAALKKEFIATGVIHLIAVSGYNVTLAIRIFSDWLKPLGRLPSFIGGTVGIIFFSLLVGSAPSLVRASIMGWTFLLARWLFRQSHSWNILLLAAGLMVLLQPSIIIQSIGFQLSFGAMVGLMSVTPLIQRWLNQARWLNKIPHSLSAILAETLGAQILVWPIIWHYFGQISLIGIAANLLTLPIVPLAMNSTIALLFFYYIPIAGVIIAALVHLQTSWIIYIVNLTAKSKYALLKTIPLPWWNVALVYLIGLLFIILINRYQTARRHD